MPNHDPGDEVDRPDECGGDIDAAVRNRYEKIFHYSNDAIIIVDFETESFLDVNPAACELLGYRREELLELAPEDIHPDDIERIREEFIADVLESGSGWTDDMACLTNDGEIVHTEISGAVIDTPDGGSPTRMVAMLRNVSERVEHRRELEATVDRLEQFAQVLSHDIRNPLNVAAGHIELARESGDDEHFDAVVDALDRVEELVDQLLVLSKRADAIGEQEVVELESVGRAAWQSVSSEDATVDYETGLELRADQLRLQELFENLFRNAVEHGGSTVRVTVDSIDDSGETGFYVADDGPGIPESERGDVFDWGYSSSTDGSGFGLAIVEEIAEGHGWEVAVTESADGGVRFEFRGVETA